MTARFPLKTLAVLLLPLCLVWNLLPRPAPASQAAATVIEWPATWQGRRLRPLALSEVERRFARSFPGQIARLSNDRDVLIWRYVTRPTRMLHPASDCYRALGWRIRDERLVKQQAEQAWEAASPAGPPQGRGSPLGGQQAERAWGPASPAGPPQGRGSPLGGQRAERAWGHTFTLWRCFTALSPHGDARLKVCERIEDSQGRSFTDASAWYWAALAGRSTGPWQAITVASPIS